MAWMGNKKIKIEMLSMAIEGKLTSQNAGGRNGEWIKIEAQEIQFIYRSTL